MLISRGVCADFAQLVVSELVCDAVRGLGDFVPLVVEVEAVLCGADVRVHDPQPLSMPVRSGASGRSGRGWV